MLGLLGVVRPRWPRLPLGRSRQAGLDIVRHILFEPESEAVVSRPCGGSQTREPGSIAICQADRTIFSRRAQGGGRRMTRHPERNSRNSLLELERSCGKAQELGCI
jgi:hypothetical protein